MVQPRHTLSVKIRKSERLNLLIKADLYHGRTPDFDVKKKFIIQMYFSKKAALGTDFR